MARKDDANMGNPDCDDPFNIDRAEYMRRKQFCGVGERRRNNCRNGFAGTLVSLYVVDCHSHRCVDDKVSRSRTIG
jgi:hypothetical protein